MKIIITAFLFITVMIAGCKNSSVDPETKESLIPLNADNYWLYKNYAFIADGTIEIPYSWKYGFIIQDPAAKEFISSGSGNYQISRCTDGLIPFADTGKTLFTGNKLVYQNNSGFYYSGIVRKDTLIMSFNDLIFPYPVEKGRTVKGHVFYYNDVANSYNIPYDVITNYTCVSTDSLIITTLGNFRCIVYKMAYIDEKPVSRNEVYYFIKPGLGIVAMVNMEYKYDLQKYSCLNKILLTEYKIK